MTLQRFILVSSLTVFTAIFAKDTKDPKECGPKYSGKCKTEQSKKIGCCKLKYQGGGYDYVKATEEECKNNENYHMFMGYNNSLCMEWEEK